MRDDMSKVITERERYNSRIQNRKTGLRLRRYDPADEYEDQPKRLPLTPRRPAGGSKSFSDVLSPLRRYLKKQVGRPWDKVYSELKANLDDRSVTGRHVFEHINLEVEQHAYLGAAGRVYQRPIWGKTQLVEGFYVHPRTRLLCWKPRRNYRKERQARLAAQEVTRIPLNATQNYVKIKGIWYIGDYAECERPAQAARQEVGPDWSYYRAGQRWLRLVSKKQCNQKELKAAGLSNDPVD